MVSLADLISLGKERNNKQYACKKKIVSYLETIPTQKVARLERALASENSWLRWFDARLYEGRASIVVVLQAFGAVAGGDPLDRDQIGGDAQVGYVIAPVPDFAHGLVRAAHRVLQP